MANKDVIIRHNSEAEAGVIGCCLANSQAMAEASGLLQPEYFYDPRRQRIFAVMLELWESGKPIDLIAVSDILQNRKKSREAGDFEEVVSCSVVSTGMWINRYHWIVRDAYLHRQTIAKLDEAKFNLNEDGSDPDAFLSGIIDNMMTLKQHTKSGSHVYKASDLTEQNLKNVVERIDSYNAGKITGVPSGVDELDALTGGFRPGQMIVIAGRPSTGKTDLGVNLVMNAAVRGYSSLFISLEMSAEDVWVRVSSLFTNIFRQKHFNGTLSDFELQLLSQSTRKLSDLPIIVADAPRMGIADIRSIALEAQHRIGAQILIVDYVGLVSPPKGNMTREQEVAKISAGLKSIARELNIPVIAISQLSRAVESRNPPIPRLSDLRDSGAIEQDADVVVLLYRKSYYDKDISDDSLRLDIAKCRNGQTEVIEGVPYNRGTGRVGEASHNFGTKQTLTKSVKDLQYKELVEDEAAF